MRHQPLHRLLCAGLALAFGAASFAGIPAAAAEGAAYLSELTVVPGETGEKTLLDQGYSVFHPMLRRASGESFWIGYRTTADKAAAVRGLHTDAGGGFQWDTDSAAPAVTSLYFLSSETNGASGFDKVMPIPNNGAAVLPDATGAPAVFRTVNGQGYLALIREDVWKNYIGSIAAATASSQKDAVTQLYQKGCEFFLDHDFSDDASACTYVGYTRTNDASKAVTDIILSAQTPPGGYEKTGAAVQGRELYVTRDEQYGNPVMDLEPFESGTETALSAPQLAAMIAANGSDTVTKPYILQNSDYQKLTESGGTYQMSDVIREDGAAGGLSFASAKDKLLSKQRLRRRMMKLEDAGGDDGATGAPEATEETADPKAAQELEGAAETAATAAASGGEETASAGDKETSATANTASGGSSFPWPAVILPLAAVVLIPVVTVLLRKRMLKTKGGDNEKQ